MSTKQINANRPIRVVVFGGGPALERGIRKFICRLEERPEINVLGVYCQSAAQNFKAVVRDLWKRRRLLAAPLLIRQGLNTTGRYLTQPRSEIELKRKIARLADRIHFVSDIHADEVLDLVRSVSPDLGLVYGSPILKPSLFEIPTLGTLGIHHGKVPEYRGKKTMFWAMFNREESVGVTIQKVNPGLDTGEVVQEGQVVIDRRSQRDVWNELQELGLDLYIQAIIEVKNGTASYRPQVGKKGKLYGDPSVADILAFWWRQFKRRWGMS